MANVMSLKHLQNKVHRNGFDLSFRNSFTAKVGELLPVMCKEVLPGDKFKIEPSWFTRTTPVNTASFTRIREYYDFFFVPFNVLWSGFDDFITQMDNPSIANSLTSSSPIPGRLPMLQMSQIKSYITAGLLDGSTGVNNNNVVGLNRGATTIKLLQYLGYGGFDNPSDSSDVPTQSNIPVNAFKLLAYQKIYQDFYRDSQWEKSAPWTFNVDYISQNSNYQLDISKLYSSKGLLSSSTLFDLRYCNWNKDYFMGLLPRAQFGDTSFAPVTLPTSESFSTELMTPYVNVTGYEDNIAAGSLLATAGSINPQNTRSLISVHSSGSSSYNLHSLDSKVTHIYRGVNDNVPGVASLSILALRQAEALQKWKEISLSGDKDFRSQMQKHWNVDVGFSRSRMCKYLGGTFGNISISEVVNTNLSADSSQADIAGKGIGSGDGSIEFECKKDYGYGLLMCIYHAVPLLDYENFMIDKFNTKLEATDFAIPEFDSVGMQEVSGVELSAYGEAGTALGYAPRYVEYKTSVDLINGAFCTWHKYTKNNGYNSWVAPLRQHFLYVISSDGGFSYPDFKVSPKVLDSIFVASADSYMSTDNLLCCCNFNISAVRNLDYDGLPY